MTGHTLSSITYKASDEMHTQIFVNCSFAKKKQPTNKRKNIFYLFSHAAADDYD